MTRVDDLHERAHVAGLAVLGSLVPKDRGNLPETCKAIALLGPDGARFWAQFSASPEYLDGQPDPIDRWSTRVLHAMAAPLGATPLFPFGPAPYHPFYAWAVESGRSFASPVSLLVHDTYGLMVSFRGALALPYEFAAPPAAQPCGSCASKPCLSACPVGALDKSGYAVAACHSYLRDHPDGRCMTQGCQVRRACPVGLENTQPFEQSHLHMKSFHPQ